MKGSDGGAWDADTHAQVYGTNLNDGLGRFVTDVLAPRDLLDFGSGLAALPNFIADRIALDPSVCIEPEVRTETRRDRNLSLINLDIFADPSPVLLARRFDLVMSIEVAEHIPRAHHEALFDYLVARAGRWILFSAARPGQGGLGHIAERDELEWRAEFTDRGCVFDPEMTARARHMSNPRNINHRRNVQVFRAPKRSAALTSLEERATPYLQDLLAQVLASGKPLTGNLFYAASAAARGALPSHSLHWKREALTTLAVRADRILDVGFAAGHSSLLFLLANPDARIDVVDPLHHAYAKPCFDYLNAMFPGRLTLHAGASTSVLSRLPHGVFDLVHLDGGKDLTIAEDLAALRPLMSPGHALCISDTQNPTVGAETAALLADGRLETAPFEAWNTEARRARKTHLLARYERSIADRQALRATEGQLAPQIPAAPDPTEPTADYILTALREVEDWGIDGAVVAVGTAGQRAAVLSALAASRLIPRAWYVYDAFAAPTPTVDAPTPDAPTVDAPAPDAPGAATEGQAEPTQKAAPKHGKTPPTTPSPPAPSGAAALRDILRSAGLRDDKVALIDGPPETTLRLLHPERIAVLYVTCATGDPTLAALTHLYDRIVPGGHLILDGYGLGTGGTEAVDGFFAARGEAPPVEPLDATVSAGRL